MAYIGQGIKQGTFKVLDTSGNTYNGSNTTFSLGTQVGSAAQLLVSHDGVIQKAGTDYTLATGGTQITFSTAPASGASIFITEISGAVGGTVTPSDASVTTDKLGASSVTTAKLGADAVTSAKIADDSISDEHLDITAITGQTAITSLADTDKFLVSDASDSGNLKYVEKQYLPSGKLVFLTRQAATSSVGALYFDNVFTSTYNHYICVINTLRPVSDGDSLRGRVNYNGSPKSSAKYRYISDYTDTGGTRNMNGSDSDTEFKFADEVKSDAFQGGYAGVWNIFTDIADTSDRCSFRYMGSGSFNNGSGNAHISITGGGYFDNGHDEINGMDFYYNSGSIAQYDITFYGVIKS
jgi:hypothetical protein